jgi:hypothetical protein
MFRFLLFYSHGNCCLRSTDLWIKIKNFPAYQAASQSSTGGDGKLISKVTPLHHRSQTTTFSFTAEPPVATSWRSTWRPASSTAVGHENRNSARWVYSVSWVTSICSYLWDPTAVEIWYSCPSLSFWCRVSTHWGCWSLGTSWWALGMACSLCARDLTSKPSSK